MKKNLILTLALVFVLGIASTAFAAANPFVDVPAKHWAYDAVTKLAQAGILDGYGDGTYKGGNLATRYEMAQATAKAMARSDKANAANKALIDKLAVEFAAELNNLGVRVAKLEKNASTIKFTGDARARWQTNYNWSTVNASQDARAGLRIRLNAVANVNDNVTFNGRIYYELANSMNTPYANTGTGTNGSDAQAWMNWEIGYLKWQVSPDAYVKVGRMDPVVLNGILAGPTGMYDGIEVGFAQTQSLSVKMGYGDITQKAYGNATTDLAAASLPGPAYVGFFDVTYKANKNLKFFGGLWWSFMNDNAVITNTTAGQATFTKGYPYQLWGLGFDAQLSKDWNLAGYYSSNSSNAVQVAYPSDLHTAWVAQLKYGMADRNAPGTWSAALNYRDIKPFGLDTYTMGGGIMGNEVAGNSKYALAGYKGFGVQVEWAMAKNIIGAISYYSNTRNGLGDATQISPQMYIQTNFWF